MDTRRMHRGQAMMELAAGMFALALVLSALFTFAAYIVQSLDEQRDLRSRAGSTALVSSGVDETYCSASSNLEVPVEPFAADWLLPEDTIKVEESVHIPTMKELQLP